MPLIRNVSGVDLFAPWLGRVVFDEQTVEVPAEGWQGVTAYTQIEGTWAPADAEAERLHSQMLADVADYAAALNPAAAVVEESTAADLVAAIADMDADEAAALLEAEQARPKPRKTVLKAVADRLAEFNPNTTDTESDDTNTTPQEG